MTEAGRLECAAHRPHHAPASRAAHLQRPKPRHLRGQRRQLVPAQVELRQAGHLPDAGRQAAELVAVQQQHRQAGQRRQLRPGHPTVAQPVAGELEGLQAGERAQGGRQAGQPVVAQVRKPRAGQALQEGGRQLLQPQVPAVWIRGERAGWAPDARTSSPYPRVAPGRRQWQGLPGPARPRPARPPERHHPRLEPGLLTLVQLRRRRLRPGRRQAALPRALLEQLLQRASRRGAAGARCRRAGGLRGR
jgi:hypothetical protein